MQLRGGGEQLTCMRSVYAVAVIALSLLAGCSSEKGIKQAKAAFEAGKPEETVRTLDRTLPEIADPQQRAEGLLLLGDALFKLGHVADAITAYQRAAILEPNDRGAARKLAELMVATGNPQSALPLIEGLLAEQPNDPELLALHGAALVGVGQRKEAERSLRRALALRPDFSDAGISLAEVLLQDGHVDEARAILTSTAQAATEPSAWLALGRLEEQNGNRAEAEIAYRSAVHVQDSAESNFRLAQFLQRSSKLAEAQQVLAHLNQLNANALATADFEMQKGKGSDALHDYVTTIRGWIESKSAKSKTVDTAVVNRAVEAALMDDGTPAKMRAAKATILLNQHRQDLTEGTQKMLETEIALTRGDLPAAARAANAASVYMPRSSAAHYLKGVVLDRLGDPAEAQKEWQTAIEIDGHMPSRLVLAQCALRQADLDVAEEQVAAVLRDEPANLEALLVYARALERERRYDAADAIVQRALAIDPARAEAYVIAGNSAMGRKADGVALLAFEKALLFDPRSRTAVNGLLQVFAQGRPNADAVTKIERMAAAPPQSATLYEIAGRLYSMIGKKEQAEAALQKALQVDGQRPTAALALWKVDRTATPVEVAEATQHDGASDEDVRAYELQMKQGDPSGVAANNLAFAYAARGERLERAFDLAMQSVNRIPGRAEPMDTLGFVLLKMRQYSAAADAFERALELKPDSSTRRHIQLHLADAYEASGLTAKAAELRRSAARVGG